MIFFLYGKENFLVQRKVKEIGAKYQEKYQSGLSFDIFDFAENGEKTFWRLKNFLQACSMFPEKKMAVVKNILEAELTVKKELSALLKELKLFDEENYFVVLSGEGELKKTDPLAKLTEDKRVKKEKFERLQGIKLKNWLLNEIKNRGGEIELPALDVLLSATRDDLWRLSNELDKLLSYAPKITTLAVEALVVSSAESNIFETAEAIVGGEKKKAWELFYRQLSQGEDANYIFAMIVRQTRILLLVASLVKEKLGADVVAKKTGLHPFVVKKAIWQLRKIKEDCPKKLYDLLAKLEIKIKNGQIDPGLAIDWVIAGR